MDIFSSSMRYGAIARALHWATVLLVVVAWLLGILGDALPGKPAQAAGLFVHISAGLLVVLLTAMRLAWRGVDSPPHADADGTALSRWLLLASRLTHIGLYTLLIVVPLVGISVQFARGNGLPIFGLFQVASPWVADRGFARTLKEIHELLAHTLMAMAVLHAAAALLHHWVLGDRTLLRMLPGK
ncbi:MAG: putative cytochrome [Tardiphaga sp.]|jgi:cytochrome b561|uniref:cytochrome b n=1 Tax=Tardiphaga sp. TaxID=1926292 RepID=UPI0026030DF3|nr:cytochrome b/b6 domain-containing protein [Tardiphaga sp.]MDB5501218.1 putative cytochrome [Tardiphaga sp.]